MGKSKPYISGMCVIVCNLDTRRKSQANTNNAEIKWDRCKKKAVLWATHTIFEDEEIYVIIIINPLIKLVIDTMHRMHISSYLVPSCNYN